MVKWAYGVTTVLTRAETLLPLTLASLSRGGFDKPAVFLDGATLAQATEIERKLGSEITAIRQPPRIGCYGNWMLGLTELYIRNPDADRYAMFQDDIEVVTNLKSYLDACHLPAGDYWNLFTMPYTPTKWQVEPPDPSYIGWRPSNQLGKGALALVFNRKTVVDLLTNHEAVSRAHDATVNKRQRNLDGLICHVLLKKWRGEGTEWIHFPSLVQHKGTCTTVRDFIRFLPDADSFPGSDYDAVSWIGKASQPAVVHAGVNRKEEVERIERAMRDDEERMRNTTDPKTLRKLAAWQIEYKKRLRTLGRV